PLLLRRERGGHLESDPRLVRRAPAADVPAGRGLSVDQRGNVRVGKHAQRLAALQQGAEAASPMRCHDDQVAAVLLRGADDGIPGTIAQRIVGVAVHAGGPCPLGEAAEERLRALARPFLVLGRRGGRAREDGALARRLVLVERRKRRDARLQRAGNRNALLDGLLGERRAVDRDQYVLVHCDPPFHAPSMALPSVRALPFLYPGRTFSASMEPWANPSPSSRTRTSASPTSSAKASPCCTPTRRRRLAAGPARRRSSSSPPPWGTAS